MEIGFATVLFVTLLQVAVSNPVQEKEYSPVVKNCLLECLTCVEFWGDIYNGHACADTCLMSGGSSKDLDCKLGFTMNKRYQARKATQQCVEQCKQCSRLAGSPGKYNERSCYAACELSSGQDVDTACSRHHYGYFYQIQK